MKRLYLGMLATGCLLLIGCNRTNQPTPKESQPKEETKDTPASNDESEKISYENGKGLKVNETSIKMLGILFGTAEKKSLVPVVSVSAQVYRSSSEAPTKFSRERTGMAYATVLVEPVVADQLQAKQTFIFNDHTVDGTLWRVDRTQLPVTGKVELLMELSDPQGKLSVGSYVNGHFQVNVPPTPMVVIPTGALLKTVQGTFVYVKNGDYLLKTPVQQGQQLDQLTAITQGLQGGETLVVQPVENLYLIELRLSKGGGDSD